MHPSNTEPTLHELLRGTGDSDFGAVDDNKTPTSPKRFSLAWFFLIFILTLVCTVALSFRFLPFL